MENSGFGQLKISIVGLGVIGGSFAKGLKNVPKAKLFGIDTDENTLAKAKNEGIIDQGFVDPYTPVKESDIIILCIYPKQITDFVLKYKDCFKDGVIITDASGIKQGFIEKINPILPQSADFVFGHPMAGREKKGIDFSSGEVFKGANYLIIPNERNKEENINKIEELVKAIGFKRISRISAKRHDELISYTSQLPHAIAVALINSDEWEEDMGLFIGDSYRELTRIASINESLWCQLFMGNGENLIHQIDLFQNKLNQLKTCLVNEDEENLIKLFKESSQRREKIT
ncbi:MAG: prephenate dehydrogenase [Bacillota bacterium]|nr:prephenate dehydrogenase [Bacillota bacterium]